MKLEYQDKIDDYVTGQMPEEERAAFDAECTSNTELREQLKFTQEVQKVVKQRGDMLGKMNEWDADFPWEEEYKLAACAEHAAAPNCTNMSNSHEENHMVKKSPKPVYRKVFFAAAVVVAVCVTGFWLQRSAADKSVPAFGIPNGTDHMNYQPKTEKTDADTNIIILP